MTKEEIKALVASKIEGQGTNVDAGSVLPAILNGILDLIPDAVEKPDLLETDKNSPAFIEGPSILNVDDMMPRAVIDAGADEDKISQYLFLEYDNHIYSRITPTRDMLFNNPASQIIAAWGSGSGLRYEFIEGGAAILGGGSYIVLMYDEGEQEICLRLGEI